MIPTMARYLKIYLLDHNKLGEEKVASYDLNFEEL